MQEHNKTHIAKYVIGVLAALGFIFAAIATYKEGLSFPVAYAFLGSCLATGALVRLNDEQISIGGLFILGLVLAIPGPVPFGGYSLLVLIYPSIPLWPFAILIPFTTVLGIVLIVKSVRLHKGYRGESPLKA